jgi:hypothetical protein
MVVTSGLGGRTVRIPRALVHNVGAGDAEGTPATAPTAVTIAVAVVAKAARFRDLIILNEGKYY